MSLFTENFWGEKNNGFDVLYHNVKHGLKSSTDFADFLRESSTIEETYSKLLAKLAKQTNNFNHLGSFAPFWQILKTLAEKLSSTHLQIVHKWQDLMKDVQRYVEELQKKQKSIKDGESGTLDTVHSIQQTTVALQKAKEVYHARCLEYEKLKRENAQPKELEKAETKFRKASDEYKYYVEKYSNVRNDFEKKMTDSCKHFQELEEAHLQQMKDFVDTYAKAVEQGYQLIGEVHSDFRTSMEEQTVDNLIYQFVEGKTTGKDRPGPVEFEDADLSNLPPMVAQPEVAEPTLTKRDRRDSIGNALDKPKKDLVTLEDPPDYNWSKLSPLERSPTLRGSRWFLGKKNKKKEKKKKKRDKEEKDKEDTTSKGSESPPHRVLLDERVVFTDIKERLVSTGYEVSSGLAYAARTIMSPALVGCNRSLAIKIPNKLSIDLSSFRRHSVCSSSMMRANKRSSGRRFSSCEANNANAGPKTPEVDEEGFSIRPEDPLDKDQDSTSSDSDSDSEERNRQFIKVEIKPLSPNDSANGGGGGNVEDIMKSIGGLKLSPTAPRRNRAPTALDPNMKRSVSVSETMNFSFSANKPSHDLLGMDFFTSSSASTPTGGNYSFPSPLVPSSSNLSGFTSTEPSEASTPVSNVTTAVITPATPVPCPVALEVLNENGTETSPPALPSKQHRNSFSAIPSITTNVSSSSLLTGPPPKTVPRKIPTHSTRGRQSPIPPNVAPSIPPPMSRADSSASLNSMTSFTTTSMPVGSSRGPSPLTIGMSDTIPLAVAFTETVNAYFKGNDKSRCLVKLFGGMMISFPAGIVRVLADNPTPAVLAFRVKNIHKIETINVNSQLVVEDRTQSSPEGTVYVFEMSQLTEHLRRQAETNKAASYFNIDILKYQIKAESGADSTPLLLTSYWKCEPHQTDFRLDYKYNGAALGLPNPLTNVSVLVPVSGNVQTMHSLPVGAWNAETQRGVWKISDISPKKENGGCDCIRAKFELSDGPTTPATVAVQFACEGTTVSGIDFELVGTGYRLSLNKKRLCSGKYLSDTDHEVRYV
ncbi:F-BAR domain only protein 2-like isoform X2 [Lineus longissimus]|uniref:F-BAR domain only protein 2-like isoform X2 n=1 Tax=Lineus longissimus TaxID=88925 RepID=UPI00315CCEA7